MIRPRDNLAFFASLQQSNLSALRIQAICGTLGQPFFALLDIVFATPKLLPMFALLRGLCVVCYLVAFALSFGPGMARYANLAGTILAWVTGRVIVVMVMVDTGPTSSYYAGLNIPILATSLLFTWSWRWNLLMGVPIHLAYIVPNLFHPALANNIPIFIAHNFFIFFTIFYITVAQHFNVIRRREVFFANLALNQAKSELELAHDKLKELDRVKSQFFANITHELRTPLTLILTPVDAIVRGELGDFQAHQLSYFRSIRENSLRLLKLINDLLELTRLKDSQVRLRIEETPIRPFVHNIVETVQGMAERKQIEIVLACDDVALWIDTVQMERVFLNVLANALKFTPVDGRITIQAQNRGDSVVFVVQDTGIGIPAEHLPHIFDRFFQSDASNTRQYGGTGIGLSLVRELVNLHGGTITAESEVDQGTTLRLTLPKGRDHFRDEALDRRQRKKEVDRTRRNEDTGVSVWTHQIVDQESFRYLDIDMATERRVIPRGELPFKEGRLLVVEDNVELLRFLHSLLGESYEIYTAMDGETALKQAQERKPDLVLSDVMIPLMDGFALCEAIKSDPATMHIPVILLTARTKLEDRIAGMEHGADAYLTKPFSPRELRTLVRETLRNRAQTAKIVLRKRLDAIQLMSARMAHEIFNPLNMIQNAVEAIEHQLERSQDTDTLQRLTPFLAIARRAIPRIQHTVELMKHYSREGYTPTHRPHDLQEMLDNLLQVVSIPAHKRCDFAVEVRTSRPLWCDAAEFHQALINVIENAIDAIDEEGEIRIEVWDEGDEIAISVQDNGCGIPPDDLDRITSPFFTTKGPNKGMGLGMTITLQTVESMGGEIAIQSKEGVGTRITLRLPQRTFASSRSLDSPQATPLPALPSQRGQENR